MTSPRKAQTTTHSASDAEWAEAVRREAVLRPLSTQASLAPLEVKTAAHDLSVSRASVYKLLRVFLGKPVTASLLPRKPGPANGTRRHGINVLRALTMPTGDLTDLLSA